MVNVSTKFTIRALELFPDDKRHYELIDGELIVTKSLHWNHQKVEGRLYAALDNWTFSDGGFGEAVPSAGVVFEDENAVETDGAWVADRDRLEQIQIVPAISREPQNSRSGPSLHAVKTNAGIN